MRFISAFILLLASSITSATTVEIHTNMGNIVVKLNAAKAPKTVANFLDYTRSGQYNNTIFHRVINGFMIQGGGYDSKYQKKSTKEAIQNEADNGLKNVRGSIAMARTNDPHSATAQFFINVKDNDFLNHTSKTPRGWGYTVFGKVINGIKVVDKIKRLKTGAAGPFPSDVPQEMALINTIKILP